MIKNKVYVLAWLAVLLIVVLFSVQLLATQKEKVSQTVNKESYTTIVLGGESPVNLLRRFRDEILAVSPQGKEYIKLFYKLLPDAIIVMIRDSHIRAKTAKTAAQIVPLIEPVLETRHIPPKMGEMINSLLDDFVNTKTASENLRNHILKMKKKWPLMDYISHFNNSSYTKPKRVKHETPHNQRYSRKYIFVKFKSGVPLFRIHEICNKIGITIDKYYKDINVYKIKVPLDKVMETIDIFLKYDEVEYAEPDYTVGILQRIPNDPYFDELWGLHNIGQGTKCTTNRGTPDADIDAPESWEITTGRSVVVAVIDTGVNYNHEDLASNMWVNMGEIPNNGIDDDHNGYVDDCHGWDFYNNDNDPMDDHNHGTHCSGIIGAIGNNNKGVVGVNWLVKIMPLKFLDQCGRGSTSDAIEAIQYAKNMGAKIASNSWGGYDYSQPLYDEIKEFGKAGGLFVAAAGNDGKDNDVTPMYPASYDLPNIIAVAATDNNDNLASFSNYGRLSVDLGAPGVGILSTVIKGYDCMSGTSMATPHVSGAVALLWTVNPGLSNIGVKAKILSTVDPLPCLMGKCVSNGRLNIDNAVTQTHKHMPHMPWLDLLLGE